MFRCATMNLPCMNAASHKACAFGAAGQAASVFGWCLGLLVGVACLLANTGCRSSSGSLPDPEFSPAEFPQSPFVKPPPGIYRTNELHEGDVVGITFQYSTNFNSVQKIALDGMLNLDMVGTIKAAGKSVTELQQDLTRVYQTLAKGDVATVKLISSDASVYVSGSVLRPGMVAMDRPLTVVEAIMAAGGFDNARAKLSDVTILRIEHGRQQTYHINAKKVLEGKEKMPFYLKPFDIVFVSAKVFNY